MRNFGLTFSALLLVSTSAAAQTPLVSVSPSTQPSELLSPRTVNAELVACTDLPTDTLTPTSTLRVLAPHTGDSHLASYRGHLVVLNGGTPQGFAIGQRYFTRRIQSPLNGQMVGPFNRASIRTSGWLTVVAADDQSALARIDYACTAIDAGDYLDPYVEPTLPTVVASEGATDFSNLGKVLAGPDRKHSFGAGDFMNIDRGSAAGMTLGTRLAFYRDRRNGTPLVQLGIGIVVEVAPETAKVVVQRASEEIRLGDYFGVRGAPLP